MLLRVHLQEASLRKSVEAMYTWKKNVRFAKKHKIFEIKSTASLLASSFSAWKQHFGFQYRMALQQVRVDKFRDILLRKTFFRAWKSSHKQSIILPKQLELLLSRALSFNKAKLRRKSFKSWKSYITDIVQPACTAAILAERLNKKFLLKKSFEKLI